MAKNEATIMWDLINDIVVEALPSWFREHEEDKLMMNIREALKQVYNKTKIQTEKRVQEKIRKELKIRFQENWGIDVEEHILASMLELIDEVCGGRKC